MKIFKILIGLLLIASIFLTVSLISSLSQTETVGFWKIFLICFLGLIPIGMGSWILFKKKGTIRIKNKNIGWSLIIFALGITWLFIIRKDQNKTVKKMVNTEQSAHEGN